MAAVTSYVSDRHFDYSMRRDCTVLMFLPPRATAIVMNYWQSVSNKSMQMETIYYWNLEYLDLQYFPVLPEDYEATSDRPDCEKPADDPHYTSQVPYYCGLPISSNKRHVALQAHITCIYCLKQHVINQDKLASCH